LSASNFSLPAGNVRVAGEPTSIAESLGAAIKQVHSHKLKVTGHLCSVTWHEAIALGIDDLEHGPVFSDSDFVADKKPDLCASGAAMGFNTWANVDISGARSVI
jgi:hypothetical protein